MAAIFLLKKPPYMKEWMAQAYPPKEANTVKKMNGQLLLFFPNKMTHYFKVWTIASGALKKINCLYKNLILQLDPLNSSNSKELQGPERKLGL